MAEYSDPDDDRPFTWVIAEGTGVVRFYLPHPPMPPMHYALATDYTVDDMQAKLL